ncbi:MAG: FAD-dependent oxidoreductase [Candidatus Melainabacteria bacterium]|nr:FAD-dependent oxidoreductase [Candidatus Melainabacteria bacterium]
MPEIKINYKDLPSCDVLVAGGGSAGVAAAVGALHATPLQVVLIEKASFLGGMATGALVTPMMKNMPMGKGLFLEVCNRLAKAGGGAIFEDGNPGWFNPEVYKIVLDEMCVESNVRLMFESQIISCDVLKDEIKNIYFFNKGGFFSISAKEFIDCTGDGDLIALSGVSYKAGENNYRQAMSLRFMMAGVDLKTFANWLKENDKAGDSPVYFLNNGDILLSGAHTFEKNWTLKPFFDEAFKNGDLKKEDAAYFQIFSVPDSQGLVAFNCPRITPEDKILDPLNNEDTSWLLVHGRQMIKRQSTFCKKYLPGFKDSYVCQIAPYIGVRESRRLVGQYVLTKEDVLSAKKFKDAIANSNWPIDIHPPVAETRLITPLPQQPPNGDYYQIPLRSLLPKENEIKNLIVAGRCLSADFEAQSSARIQANCWAMGEAAGLLAAKRIKAVR